MTNSTTTECNIWRTQARAEGVADGVAQTYRNVAELLNSLSRTTVTKGDKIKFLDELIQSTEDHETNAAISATRCATLRAIRRIVND